MDNVYGEPDWLAQLISPSLSVDRFFERVLGRELMFNTLADEVLRRLPDWDDINHFLSSQRFDAPRVRLEGQNMTPEDLNIFERQRLRRGYDVARLRVDLLYKGLRNGATLVIDAIDEAIPALTSISECLSRYFVANIQTNAYITFGSRRGFGLHWDDHDVIVVQLHGRKDWTFYGITRPNPLYRDTSDGERPVKPVSSKTLTRGDLVYIPRGHWHDVVGVNEPSFHLTIGINRPSGIDLVSFIADHGRDNPLLRGDLNLTSSGCPEEDYSKLIYKTIRAEISDDIVARFVRNRKEMQQSRPHLSLPHGAGSAEECIFEKKIAPAYTSSTLESTEEEVILRTNGKEWKFDHCLYSLFQLMRTGAAISVLDAYKMSKNAGLIVEKQEWLEFLDYLIVENIVYVK